MIVISFFFSEEYDLYFLIAAVIALIFIPTVDLAIPTKTSTNEANALVKTHLIDSRNTTRKFSK